MDWDALRRAEFPVTENWAYFDHAAVAPLPRRSGDAMRAWIAEQEANGVVHWPRWESKLEGLRRDLAGLIHADNRRDRLRQQHDPRHRPGRRGLPLARGDNVVTAEEEYPSNLYPWLNLKDRGVELRTVPSREGRVWPEDLDAAMDDRTRLLTISHVEWASGFRNDLDQLAELAHARGAALFVDAIQGLGPLTIDVSRTPIDFLAADGHKWLLGPEGAGVFYVRRDWIERLRPILVGWHSVTTSYNVPGIHFDLKPNARRWEGGTFNMPGLQAFAASVRLFHEIGPDVVSERILERAEQVREIARQAGWSVCGSQRPEDLSGIVALERPGIDPDAFAREARNRGIALSSRRGRVRISPHVYNGDDDLQRLAEALSGC